MICPNCGQEMPDGTKFCTYCGVVQNAAEVPAQAPAGTGNETTVLTDNPYEKPAENPYGAAGAPAENPYGAAYGAQAPAENPYETPLVNDISPKKEKKKMSKGKKLLLAIGIPVLIIAIAAALCLTVFKPTLTKWFSSPENYLKEVEKAEGGIYDSAELFGKAYGKLVSGEAFKGDTDIQIKPNEALLGLLGDSVDLSWLKSLGIKTSADSADNNLVFKLNLALNENELVTLAACYNTKTCEVIASIPELSDKSIKVSLADLLENLGEFTPVEDDDWDEWEDEDWDEFAETEDYEYYEEYDVEDFGTEAIAVDDVLEAVIVDEADETDDEFYFDTEDTAIIGGNFEPDDILVEADSIAKDILLSLPEFKNALPSEEVFNRITERYLDIVFDNLGEVTRSEEEVTAQGITEKLDVLSTTIDYATACKIGKAVLEQVKTDGDIMKIVCDFCETINEINEDDVTYEQFLEEVDNALEEIEDGEDDGTTVDVKVYVRDGKVTGRTFFINEGDDGQNVTLAFVETRKGENFGYETNLIAEEMTVSATGKGTVKDDRYTGDVAVSINGTEAMEMSMTDLYLDRDDLSMNGMYTGSFTSDFIDSIAGDDESGLSGIISTLKVAITSSKDKCSIEVSAMGIKALTIDVTRDPEPSFKAGDFKAPADDDCVNIESADDFGTWAESIDLTKIPELLKKAGIPEDLLTSLAGALMEA